MVHTRGGRVELLTQLSISTTIIVKKKDQGRRSEGSGQINKTSSRFIRGLLIVVGTLFVGLGVLGIFLPLLPTTPFLLLAAACYARSSKRFYNWLLNNKWFGNYIKNYREKKGVPLEVKLFTISLLWITILFSTVFVVDIFFVRIILILIATGVTIHILYIRTLKR